MATLIYLDDMQNGYVELVETVLRHGAEASPRGMKTREIEDCTVVLSDPMRPWPIGVGRHPKVEIGLAEAMHLIGGISDATQMVNCGKNFAMFVEHDRLRGAYGPRAGMQWGNVVKTLTDDPDSRQAGVVLWRPQELKSPSKDVPCTVSLFYRIRDGKLNATTHMRSNDVYWGVTYDFPMFTIAQQVVAWALNVPVGTYTHHATSMHAYVERDAAGFAKLRRRRQQRAPLPPAINPEWEDGFLPETRMMAAQLDARRAALGRQRRSATISQWIANCLEPTRSGGVLCKHCHYVLPESYFRIEPKASTFGNGVCWACDAPLR